MEAHRQRHTAALVRWRREQNHNRSTKRLANMDFNTDNQGVSVLKTNIEAQLTPSVSSSGSQANLFAFYLSTNNSW